MDFNCKVNIIDAIMGAGKTSAIINLINDSEDDEKFLVITPFLDEIKRYRSYCNKKNFKTPAYLKNNGKASKLNDLKRLIDKGENIISTHALFQKFDNELIDLCRAKNYTLIMDEVANVIEEYELSKQDLEILKQKYIDINPETRQLIWKDEYSDYKGKFENEKRLCELGSLVCYGDSLMVWLFPIETFNSLETYCLTPYDKDIKYTEYDYKELIHICENEKLNMIGDRNSDLSYSWYNRNKNNTSIKVLKNNIYNFFHNLRDNKTANNIWTTFKDYKDSLKGKGYTKGFLPCNARATNEYRERINVAYPINKYINPFIKNFFTMNNISVNEDGYALSEMLQFIWRSAIRDGKEIWVYIPSIRMRTLLKDWIEQNSN